MCSSDLWMEAYKLSPTLEPSKAAKNPMPRLRNPDPRGFLMAMAEKRAEGEVKDTPSIAQLLERKDLVQKEQASAEEDQGQTTANENDSQFKTPPGAA